MKCEGELVDVFGSLENFNGKRLKVVREGFCLDAANASVCEIDIELFDFAFHFLLVAVGNLPTGTLKNVAHFFFLAF